jgi:hypothetical protein
LSVSYFCLSMFFPLLPNGCFVSIFSSFIVPPLFLIVTLSDFWEAVRRYSIRGGSH